MSFNNKDCMCQDSADGLIKVDSRSLVSGCGSVHNNLKLSYAKGVLSACCVTTGPE